jgi:Protein of unknown function (DUF3108)
MWNKLAEIMQAPASKRLGIAIAVSALLHTLFFGNVDFSLPSLKKEMHLIEARIQMPKAVPKPAPKPIAEPLPEVLAEPEPVKEPVVEPKVEDVVEPEPVSPTPDPVAEIIPTPEVKPEPPVPAPVENIEPSPTPEPAQPEDIGLVINENAYQYIETEFDVRTKIDGSTEGNAKITYNLIEGNQYHIKWLTEGRGFAALLFPDLLQVSEGALTKTGLRPNQYIYQFGNKPDKNRAAAFDWQAKKVSLQTSKGTKTEDLPDGTQDLLSFMYQFMHVAPLQRMQLPIVNGKKLRIYDYSFEGEEQVNSDLGELKTIHILHSGNDDEKTELWLAIDYQYVPVKIRKIENDGKVVEMVATRITTNRPVINQ